MFQNNLAKYVFLVLFFCCTNQEKVLSAEKFSQVPESIYAIDLETAGVLNKGNWMLQNSIVDNGSWLSEISYSPLKNIQVGISYTVNNLISDAKPELQKLPGFQVKLRFINETKTFPAMLIGVNTQGRGFYLLDHERSLVMSKGIYLSASKTFDWEIGELALHANINYSFDPIDKYKVPNFSFAFEENFSKELSLIVELNTMNNEYLSEIYRNSVLLNAALRWNVSKNIYLEFQMKQLAKQSKFSESFPRYICIDYRF
jgi:hypothetical protein